jgi:integrase
MLLLTGQRLNEVGGMRWGELHLVEHRVWHLPAARTKNSKAHDVALSNQAIEIINSLPCFAALPGKPDFVFSVRGDRAVVGFSDAKKGLNKLMGVADWTLHDLRRTATTGMARLGIPPHVADRVLNHTSGTISGVAAVYNRFQYLDERRDALAAWGKFVEQLVDPETAQQNVVALRA